MSTTGKLTGWIFYIIEDADTGWNLWYELEYVVTPGERGEPAEQNSDFRADDGDDECDITSAVLIKIDTDGVCEELDNTEWGQKPHSAYGELFGRALIARYRDDPVAREIIAVECLEHAGLLG